MPVCIISTIILSHKNTHLGVIMRFKRHFALSSLVLVMGFPAYGQESSQAENIEKNDKQVETISIVGVRQERASKGATGLTLELNETPQSISVISSEQIENFAANSINDVMQMATGITVQQNETNRTRYTSRGFDIKSTQLDGIGLPNSWGIVVGVMESYGYEEVEIIRGANGQLTGIGNAGGTINYVRKRPTNENEGEVAVVLGSDALKRLEADYSLFLTESGSWAARVVAVLEDSESYLVGLEDEHTYLSVVVDGQVTDNSTVAFGASYQDANTDGNMWGGLPLAYADGTQADFDVSTSPTQDWTMWDTENISAFVEYSYIFDNDWEIKTTYNRQESNDQSKLFFVAGLENSETNRVTRSSTGRYAGDFSADLFDLTAKGEYQLFNQTHELMFGTSISKSTDISFNNPYDKTTTSAYGITPIFPYPLDLTSEPIWEEQIETANLDITLTRYFGSTKINLNDDLFVIAGFNAIDYTREGYNSGGTVYNEENEISPYLAATYSITENTNAYISYSDIYEPQDRYDYYYHFLAPSKGVNYEIGIKTQWLDNTILTSFALFSAEQDNIAVRAGTNDEGKAYYEGTSMTSEGVEIEVIGRLTENLNTTFAYTFMDIEDEAGDDTSAWEPKNAVKFSLDYTLPAVPELVVGLGGRWQSKTEDLSGVVKQDPYVLLNAFARWNISNSLSIQANINNITDEKYITGLQYVGFYAAPTNGSIKATYSF